jgi:hypothetical protein
VPYEVADADIVDAELVEVEEPEGPATGGLR